MIKFLRITAVLTLVLLSFLVVRESYAAPQWWPLVPCGLNTQPVGISKTVSDYTQPCNQCDLLRLVKNLIDFIFFAITPILATLFFVIAGVRMIWAGAVPSELSAAKRMFWQTITGVLVISFAWLATNTLLKSLARDDISNHWWELQCRTTAPAPFVTPTPGETTPPTSECQQQFGVSSSSGCADTSSCVDVSSYTASHGCESNSGTCLLSSGSAQRVQQFISAFNSAGGGSCGLRISSTIQGSGGPSVSQCHQAGNAKSGTCADFNIERSQSCIDAFYQAARTSGVVISFLDEYVAACRPANATGGNIHVNF